MLGRTLVLSIGFILIFLLNHVECQSCPEIPNVANVCESVSHSGSRVLMDTSTFTEAVQNCSCTFSTTADMIRIVTYAAPNYQQCNSAIRLYSSSGNAMRFQCLMSGTYLDTTAHKTGGAEFETFGPIYDKNYCLVLEHLGTDADTITISCNGIDSTQTDTTTIGITTTTPGVTTTSSGSTTVDVSSFTTTTTTTTLGADSSSSVISSTQASTGSVTTSTSSREAYTTTTFVNQLNISTVTDNDTISLISDNGITANESLLGETNVSVSSNTPDQHTSEVSDSFSSSHVLIMPKTNFNQQNETFGDNSTTNSYRTNNDTNSINTIVLGAQNSDDITNGQIANGTNTIGNDDISTGKITFDNDKVSSSSQDSVYTTAQSETVRPDTPEIQKISKDNHGLTSTAQSLSFENITTTGSPEVVALFGNDTVVNDIDSTNSVSKTTSSISKGVALIDESDSTNSSSKDPVQIVLNKTVNSGMLETPEVVIQRDLIDQTSMPNSTSTIMSSINENSGLESLRNSNAENDENSTTLFGNDVLSEKSLTIGSLSLNTSDNDISSDTMIFPNENGSNVLLGKVLSELDSSVDTHGPQNSTAPKSIGTEKGAILGNDALPSETISPSLDSERLISNISSIESFPNTEDIKSAPELIIHHRSSFGVDTIPTDKTTFGSNSITLAQTTEVPSSVNNSSHNIMGGSVVETKTININSDLSIETATDDGMSLLSDLRRESALLDSMVKDSNLDNNNNTMSVTKIEKSIFGQDAIVTENDPTQSTGPEILIAESALNNDTKLNQNAIEGNRMSDQLESGSARITSDIRTGMQMILEPGLTSFDQSVGSNEKIVREPGRATFGPDAIDRNGVTLTPERNTFGSDTLIRDGGIVDHSTFGPDIVSVNGRTVSPVQVTVGADAIVKDAVTTRPDRATFGPDTVVRGELIVGQNRETFGQDGIVRGAVGSKTDRATFGSDAIVSDDGTNGPERVTFGQDAVLRDLGTNDQGRDTFGSDAVARDDVTIGPDRATDEVTYDPARATFGPDALGKDKVSIEPNRATFGSDAVLTDSLTKVPGRETFGPDAVVSDGVAIGQERATFGPDAVLTDGETIGPGSATFRPDNVLTDGVTIRPGRATFGPDEIVRDRISVEPERATFGQDAVLTEGVTITPGRVTFGPDAVVSGDVTNGPDRATFGPDAVLSDGETSRPGRATFGPDAVLRDGDTIGPGRTTFGQDAILTNGVTIRPGRATFGPDSIKRDHVTKRLERETFGPDAILIEDVTIRPGRVTFGPDAVARDGVSIRPGLATFGPDAVLTDDITIRPGRTTFGPDAVVRDGFTIGPGRATFGPDAVLTEGVTVRPGRATFGPDAVVRDDITLGPERATFGTDTVLKDGITTRPGRETFGPDAILNGGMTTETGSATFEPDVLAGDRIPLDQERVLLSHDTLLNHKTPFPSDLNGNNQSSLNNIQMNEVNEPSIIRDNIEFARDRTNIENDFVTRKIFTDGPDLANENSKAPQTTSNPQSVGATTDAPFTRVVFGEFIERRKLFTSTESSIGTTVEPPIMPSGFVNMLSNEPFGTSIVSNDTVLNSGVNTVSANDNRIMVNDTGIISTMSDSANDPGVEETILRNSENLLLNSVKSVSQNLPGGLLGQIMDTVSDLPSNETDIVAAVESKRTTIETPTESSTRAQEAQETTTDAESQTSTLSIETMESTTRGSIDDIINSGIEGDVNRQNESVSITDTTQKIAITVKEGMTETVETTKAIQETTTQDIPYITTERSIIDTSPVDPTSTMSTLPPIIPADRKTINPVEIQREDVASVIKSVPSTQRPIRTTERQYNVMDDQHVLLNDRTVIDSGGVPKTDQDQLNVSLEDEPNKSLFNMNNKTYIIIVIAIAGFIILVAIVAVIIRNRRKSNAAKAEMNNGVSASNHNNAAFDASEAERGNVAPATNGVDPPKPTVEVLEPNGDS